MYGVKRGKRACLTGGDSYLSLSDSHINNLAMHHKFLKNMFESRICRITVMGSMHEVGFYEGSIDEL